MLCSSFRSSFLPEGFLEGVHLVFLLHSRLHSYRFHGFASSFHSSLGSKLYSGLPEAYHIYPLLRVKPDKKETRCLPTAFLGGSVLDSRLGSTFHSGFRSYLRSVFRSHLCSFKANISGPLLLTQETSAVLLILKKTHSLCNSGPDVRWLPQVQAKQRNGMSKMHLRGGKRKTCC